MLMRLQDVFIQHFDDFPPLLLFSSLQDFYTLFLFLPVLFFLGFLFIFWEIFIFLFVFFKRLYGIYKLPLVPVARIAPKFWDVFLWEICWKWLFNFFCCLCCSSLWIFLLKIMRLQLLLFYHCRFIIIYKILLLWQIFTETIGITSWNGWFFI